LIASDYIVLGAHKKGHDGKTIMAPNELQYVVSAPKGTALKIDLLWTELEELGPKKSD